MPFWKDHPGRHPELAASLSSWLREPDSLTARCERACRQFRVRLLRSGAEASVFASGGAPRVWVREVVLECDGRPVIFAHTELARLPRGRLTLWLRRLGSRSLGSLLFAFPGFRRGGLQFCRLDARSPLFARAVTAGGLTDCRSLWARRSTHRLGRQSVLVTEVFLPAIDALKTVPGRNRAPAVQRG